MLHYTEKIDILFENYDLYPEYIIIDRSWSEQRKKDYIKEKCEEKSLTITEFNLNRSCVFVESLSIIRRLRLRLRNLYCCGPQ